MTSIASAAEPLSPELLSFVYPHDDLGPVWNPTQTQIKLWAPTAKSASVLLYDTPTTQTSTRIPMQRDSNGIWSAIIHGNNDGKCHLYEITHSFVGASAPTIYQVNDPYARGCTANTGRTLIYNSAATNPDGWEKDSFVPLKNNVDAVIYEVHVRDFSISKSSGTADADRGKYFGMVRAGTRSPDDQKTGLDHLKELGITHVQLLPVHDYPHGDERQKPDQYDWYDWGYGPVLFNTPEGSYASNPDGITRQKEFKQMVQAFHRANIGVILDVVYNHTAGIGNHRGSIFDKIFPGYYYRMEPSGGYANGTHVGNEIASERPMARKFILDSIRYWMTEYHVDGFRFDLMGILDRDTMREIYRQAKQINPNAIIYGEGWDMERVLPREKMMTQTNVFGTGIAAFNDGIRDNIKGDAGNGPASGFVQGAGALHGGLQRFWQEIKGQSTAKSHSGVPVFSPNETINYDSCHDDHCLWDKLMLSAPQAAPDLRVKMDKLAAGIVLTAQGVPFIHAGDEFLRSKKLNKNSYNNNAPDVNPINWSLKSKNREVFDYYRGLIDLRKAHPAFRIPDRAQVDAALHLIEATPRNVLAYLIKSHSNADPWETILVVYNGTDKSVDLQLAGQWHIVVNEQKAGTATLQVISDRLRVESYSMLVGHDAP